MHSDKEGREGRSKGVYVKLAQIAESILLHWGTLKKTDNCEQKKAYKCCGQTHKYRLAAHLKWIF